MEPLGPSPDQGRWSLLPGCEVGIPSPVREELGLPGAAPRLRWETRVTVKSREGNDQSGPPPHSVCDCFLLLLALTHTLTSIQPMLMFPGTVEEHMRIVSVVGRVEVLDG